jgi:hypothetical protein
MEAREFIHVSFTPVCDYCVRSGKNKKRKPGNALPKAFPGFLRGDGGT